MSLIRAPTSYNRIGHKTERRRRRIVSCRRIVRNLTGDAGPERLSALAQSILVERHAHGGVHPQPVEGADFPLRLDAARGNDRMRRCAPQLLEPLEIGATHSSFALYIRAEKYGAERFELLDHIFCSNRQFFSPTCGHDSALGSVQRDDNCGAAHSRAKLSEK